MSNNSILPLSPENIKKLRGIWSKYVCRLSNLDPNKIIEGDNYRYYDLGNLEDLINSIKFTKKVLQPIIVTDNPNKETVKEQPYMVVAGHRRRRATKIAKVNVDSFYFQNLTKEEILRIQLSENLKKHVHPAEFALTASSFYFELLSQKLNLNAEELEKNYISPTNLPNELKGGLSIKSFSEAIGKSPSTVSDYFKFVSLTEKLKHLVLVGKYDYGKAILLGNLDPEKQLIIAQHPKWSKKDLIKRLADNTPFKLILDNGINKKSSSSIVNYLNGLERITSITNHYFYQKRGINLSLEKRIFIENAYDFVDNLKNSIEKDAKERGLSERLRASVKGKKAISKLAIETYLNDVFDEDPGVFAIVPVSQLKVDEKNARKVYDPAYINQLAESIRATGQIEPLRVSPIRENEYIVADGNCRTLAMKKPHIDMPKYAAVIIKNLTSKQIRITQFETALHEEDSPMERAKAIYDWKQLVDNDKNETSKAEIARSLGINVKTVSNAYNFVNANPSVRALYNHRLISYQSACEIGKVGDKRDQRELAFRSYLEGGSLESTKKIINEYQKLRNQETLFGNIKVDFTHALSKPFAEYLDPRALDRLNHLNIQNSNHVRKFYNIVNNLQKLESKLQSHST